MFAQENKGKLVVAYEKETGEVVLRFERMQLLLPADDWQAVMRSLGLQPIPVKVAA